VEAPNSLDREWSVSRWRGSGERYGDLTTAYLSRTDQSRVRDWLSLRVRRYSIVGYNGLTAKASINLQRSHCQPLTIPLS
jgi:hypothetical protein